MNNEEITNYYLFFWDSSSG